VATNGSTRARPRRIATAQRSVLQLKIQAMQLRACLGRLRREMGQTRAEQMQRQLGLQLREANEQLVLAVLRVQEQRDEIERAGQLDSLTRTPNRALMRDRMNSAITMARRRGSRAAVLFMDIDQFKQINDSLGHAVGDQVLQAVALRLQGLVRESDTVSRHGGDEFLVLLAEVARAEDAQWLAGKMLDAVAEPCWVGGQQLLSVSVSIGIALFPEDGEDAPALIARADAAMYAAKACGPGQAMLARDLLAGPMPMPLA